MSTPRFMTYLLATLLAIVTYFYGLDSPHIPKNGDEFPYAHITRLTAQSGHWLPLQSELDHMRNTKPPLLFWQGIASTSWGQQWDWWHLRYPSVIYTLLTALLVALLTHKIVLNQRDSNFALESAFIAGLTYLAFFSSYRFGRPFLVNPAENFWFFLPFFSLLYWRNAFASRWQWPLLIGAVVGIGLLYKSFALLVPVTLALSAWYWQQRRYQWRVFLRQDVTKIILIGSVSLAIFSLWFVLDPNPQAVWREFIIGENAGKFAAHGASYWATLFWGGSSVWALLLGYPMNAGLLAFPVFALAWLSFRRRDTLSDAEKMLWLWMAALFIVFTLPSQRTARYLLDAMPGLAILLALNWSRIPRAAFVVSLVFAALVLSLIGFLSWRLQIEITNNLIYSMSYIILFAFASALTVLAIFWQTRLLTNVVALLVLLTLAAFLRPFDGAAGQFSVAAQRLVSGKDVGTPCNFRAVDEGYRFLLPGANVAGYADSPAQTAQQLAEQFPFFALQLPLNTACEGCKIIGQRLEIRSRHSPQDLQKILHGDVFQQLFVREYLIQSPHSMFTRSLTEACR